ncbi:DUF3316 domain-containing protein [Leucothrix arctica]|nr:DUF3316 domain-containing protein [Leucothrix arctica]
MTTLSELIATSALIIGSTAANAAYFGPSSDTKSELRTEVKTSREDAYEAAAAKLHSLKSESSRELASELELYSSSIDKNTVQLDEGAYITIEERVTLKGELRFVGVIHVHVSYAMMDMVS